MAVEKQWQTYGAETHLVLLSGLAVLGRHTVGIVVQRSEVYMGCVRCSQRLPLPRVTFM